MIRLRKMFIIASIVLAPTGIGAPALGQDRPSASSPGQFGVTATTPSRLNRSRREMNRGREQIWEVRMTPAQTRTYAERALRRAGFACQVADAVLVAQTRDGTPLVEIDCMEGGGLIIADSEPMIATDCLDLAPGAGPETLDAGAIEACRLPGNVATVAAERQPSGR